jgi:hypothetical protein
MTAWPLLIFLAPATFQRAYVQKHMLPTAISGSSYFAKAAMGRLERGVG